MVIFHSYVKLPEGSYNSSSCSTQVPMVYPIPSHQHPQPPGANLLGPKVWIDLEKVGGIVAHKACVDPNIWDIWFQQPHGIIELINFQYCAAQSWSIPHVPEKFQLRLLLTKHANGTLPFVDDVPTVNIRI